MRKPGEDTKDQGVTASDMGLDIGAAFPHFFREKNKL